MFIGYKLGTSVVHEISMVELYSNRSKFQHDKNNRDGKLFNINGINLTVSLLVVTIVVC